MWHIYKNTNVFDSDGYGVNTDNPETEYEIIDNVLSKADEQRISDCFDEWLKDLAYDYFNGVGEWGDEFLDAWRSKVIEII